MNKDIKKVLDSWFNTYRRFLENPEAGSESQAVIVLPPNIVTRILTEKRVSLLNVLRHRRVRSVSGLAKLTGRPIEAVSRDLKVLSVWGFIRYERHGKRKEPMANAAYVVVQLDGRLHKNGARQKAAAYPTARAL